MLWCEFLAAVKSETRRNRVAAAIVGGASKSRLRAAGALKRIHDLSERVAIFGT